MAMSAANITLTSTDKRLLRWLDTDQDRFERYITAHPEAGDRIDQILALSEDVQRLLSGALDDILAVPTGLIDRLTSALHGSDLGAGTVAMDLLGIGTDTIATWFDT
jgi:hypothetical protein